MSNETEEVKWGPDEQLKWHERREEELEKRIRDLEAAMMDALFPDNNGSNLVSHAKRELELAGMLNSDTLEPEPEDPDGVFNGYNDMCGEAVLELVKVFSKQGHSGFSAGLVTQMFNAVANFGTLSPNDHSLYNDVSEYWPTDRNDPDKPGPHLQDARDSSWFSHDGGKTWYNVGDK